MISQIIQFSSDFVVSALAFACTLLVFNIGLELYVRYELGHVPDYIKKRIYKRLLIGYVLGVVLLYAIYSRAGP